MLQAVSVTGSSSMAEGSVRRGPPLVAGTGAMWGTTTPARTPGPACTGPPTPGHVSPVLMKVRRMK